MTYYLANLVLSKQFNLAITLVKFHYSTMESSSHLFKANFYRLYALALFYKIDANHDANLDAFQSSKDQFSDSWQEVLQ